MKSLCPSELGVTIDRALDYMWKRRSCMHEQPTEKIKIKMERDVYKAKLNRKREFVKMSIVFSEPRGKSKRQKSCQTHNKADDDRD